jgi:hypothetical protein
MGAQLSPKELTRALRTAISQSNSGSSFVIRDVCISDPINPEECINAYLILCVTADGTTVNRVELADGTLVENPVFVSCDCECSDVPTCEDCTQMVVFPEYNDTDEFFFNATSLGLWSGGITPLRNNFNAAVQAVYAAEGIPAYQLTSTNIIETQFGLQFLITGCKLLTDNQIRRVDSTVTGCTGCDVETHWITIENFVDYPAGNIVLVGTEGITIFLTENTLDAVQAEIEGLLNLDNITYNSVTVTGTGVGVGAVLTAVINAAGTGYTVGDLLTITGGNDDAIVEVTTIGGAGEITGLVLNVPGTDYSPFDLAALALVGGTGAAATVNITVDDPFGDVTITICAATGEIDSHYNNVIDPNDVFYIQWSIFRAIDEEDFSSELISSGECATFQAYCPCEECVYTAVIESALVDDDLFFFGDPIGTYDASIGQQALIEANLLALLFPIYTSLGLPLPTVSVIAGAFVDPTGSPIIFQFTGCRLPDSILEGDLFHIVHEGDGAAGKLDRIYFDNSCEECGCTWSVTIPDWAQWTGESGDIVIVGKNIMNSLGLVAASTLSELYALIYSFLINQGVTFSNLTVTGSLTGDVTITICTTDPYFYSFLDLEAEVVIWIIALSDGVNAPLFLPFIPSAGCCEQCDYVSQVTTEDGDIYFNNILLGDTGDLEATLQAAFETAVATVFAGSTVTLASVVSISEIDWQFVIIACDIPTVLTIEVRDGETVLETLTFDKQCPPTPLVS